MLQRFQKLSIVFVFCAAAALVWGLVLRPIDATVTPYTAPEIQPMPDAGPTAESGDVLSVTGWRDISCIRERDGWLYFAAQADTRAGGGPRCCGCGRRQRPFFHPDGGGRDHRLRF